MFSPLQEILVTCVFQLFSAFFVSPFGVAFLGRLPGVTFAEVTHTSTFNSEYSINRPRAGRASRGRFVFTV
jgi:hypothetical protein